jgi:hypothetical protein
MNDVEKIQAELERVDQFGPDFDKRVKAAGALRQGSDRSFIVRAVVGLYGISVALVVLYLLLCRGVWRGEAVFSDVEEIAKVQIMPVLMLVIGYYFGTRSPNR